MNKNPGNVKVALADDHILLRDALANMIENLSGYSVILTASNGEDLIQQINSKGNPDLLILDLNMPKMDGFETAQWMNKNYPEVRILVLTMYDSEVTLIRLLQNGVRGFLKKDAHPNELVFAIKNVVENGYYYSSNASNQLANLFANKQNQKETLEKVILNEREIEFLKFSCSEMTYKEIAQKMGMNPRSLENYRESMFSKLNIKSRVGLALYAVKHGLVRF